MYYVICQNHTWRVYKQGDEYPYLSGLGEVETALEIAELYEIVLSEFYNLPILARVA